ncbi:MAG: hypothetical protein LBC31_08395 [Treponema sp.]|jgi:hypothetical protein|nr:hypothetical protein [Treponema sp.]
MQEDGWGCDMDVKQIEKGIQEKFILFFGICIIACPVHAIDIQPVPKTEPNIEFIQARFANADEIFFEQFDFNSPLESFILYTSITATPEKIMG